MFETSALLADLGYVAIGDISWERFWVYFGVATLSSVKFFMGIVAALLKNFSFWEVQLTVGLGAIAGSWIFAYFGDVIRKWVERKFKLKRKNRSIARARRIYKMWRKWGLVGVVALAPVISPQGSIGIAVSFREKPRKIAWYLTVSIFIWTSIFTFVKETLLSIVDKL